MAAGRGGDQGLNPRAAFLAFAAGGGLFLLLVKVATNDWFPPVAASMILIVVYGFVLWDRESSGPKFEHAGDNLYYVGFLYTLISLAVTLYRFDSGAEDRIVQGFGVALSSTVFGLIGRVYVNQSSADESTQVEAAARQRLVVGHRDLRVQMDHAIQDYQRFREDLGELRESIERAKEVTVEERQALVNEVTTLEDLRGLGSRLDRAAEVLSDGLAKAQGDALDRVAARLDGALSSLNGSVASMARTINNAEGEVADMGKRLGELTVALESASASLVAAASRSALNRRRSVLGAFRRWLREGMNVVRGRVVPGRRR